MMTGVATMVAMTSQRGSISNGGRGTAPAKEPEHGGEAHLKRRGSAEGAGGGGGFGAWVFSC